ncbi:hypothetical protein EJ05DRAFT_365560 [Pseudovirgaria hyperparasitica]|uniref:Uncharacterized protein n=1 Tax=Pseudovirgaria hyperparasitica TaxID=470096 RepID=A0A6A6WB28_9PEZI|nr:uncharacterized protein EJ05DRAFT_365560 [Pseudovirgaria hyperparasitica]KAF2758807.1 hypothetical protein EJ05DRAFT_365560 [Pseudovirgaria hyperparasitica]
MELTPVLAPYCEDTDRLAICAILWPVLLPGCHAELPFKRKSNLAYKRPGLDGGDLTTHPKPMLFLSWWKYGFEGCHAGGQRSARHRSH